MTTTEQAPRSAHSHGRWEPALSVSRAKEYQKCPLQYRLHVVDGIREPATRATAAGTLVHSVLEHLYDVPAPIRTPEHATTLIAPHWERMLAKDPALLDLFDDSMTQEKWLEDVHGLVESYFRVEDPQRLQPVGREQRIDIVTDDGIRLRGFIDRIDRSPAGDLRVIDYKTGRAPSPRFVDEALFQMRFYALLLRGSDRLPARTQLLYLRSGRVLTLDPVPTDIDHCSAEVSHLWDQIEADATAGRFAPRKNPLCGWCRVQDRCPLFGGVTPELPEKGIENLLRTRVRTAA